MNPDLWSGGLLDPDSAMRLVRLRDMVATGRPLHAVMRDGSGVGTVLHWSHLFDSLLLLLAAPLIPWLGWPAALHWAGLLSGPLGLAGLGAATAWAVSPLAMPGWLWIGGFAAGGAPALGAYGMLGVVHHHILLALVSAMACGWALRLVRHETRPLPGGMVLGAWMAGGIWLSPETAPFTLMAAGALWVAWLWAPVPDLARALRAAGGACLALTALACAVDPPGAGLVAVEPDRLSVPFVVLAGGFAVTAWATLTGRRLPVAVCGAVAMVVWLVAFPQVLHGTDGLMTHEQAQAFFSGIDEMKPIQTMPAALEELIGGLFAAASLAVLLARRRSTAARLPIGYALLCVLAMLALAARHARFAAYPEAAGAAMLPVVLSTLSRATVSVGRQAAGRLAAIITLLGVPTLAALAAGSPAQVAGGTPCPVAGAIRLLAPYPGRVVLAGVNETPDLLYHTGVLTVGSLYHRNPAGFMRLRAAWRSVPGPVPGPELRATGASLILGCPGGPRSLLVADLPKTTLLDRLDENAPPAWLRRVADAGPGGYVLFAVQP